MVAEDEEGYTVDLASCPVCASMKQLSSKPQGLFAVNDKALGANLYGLYCGPVRKPWEHRNLDYY